MSIFRLEERFLKVSTRQKFLFHTTMSIYGKLENKTFRTSTTNALIKKKTEQLEKFSAQGTRQDI